VRASSRPGILEQQFEVRSFWTETPETRPLRHACLRLMRCPQARQKTQVEAVVSRSTVVRGRSCISPISSSRKFFRAARANLAAVAQIERDSDVVSKFRELVVDGCARGAAVEAVPNHR